LKSKKKLKLESIQDPEHEAGTSSSTTSRNNVRKVNGKEKKALPEAPFSLTHLPPLSNALNLEADVEDGYTADVLIAPPPLRSMNRVQVEVEEPLTRHAVSRFVGDSPQRCKTWSSLIPCGASPTLNPVAKSVISNKSFDSTISFDSTPPRSSASSASSTATLVEDKSDQTEEGWGLSPCTSGLIFRKRALTPVGRMHERHGGVWSAHLSLEGTKGENQDASIIEHNFPSHGLPRASHIFMVFDGHGPEGAYVSHFVAEALPKVLLDLTTAAEKESEERRKVQKSTEQPYHDQLRQAVQKVSESLREDPEIDESCSGTTASGVWLHGEELFVLNIGDSRVVLGSKVRSGMQATALSIDHTPTRTSERPPAEI